jgi:hypothetical protein
MPVPMNRLAVFASCLVLIGGCNKKEEAAKPGSDKPTAAASAEKPAATGLNAPGNDPKIVELAKKALTCKWEGKDDVVFAAFDNACPEYKAWRDEKAAFADKKGEATLVNFIEDPDEKVRYLGEKRLGDDLGLLKDQKLAARVLTVAEKNKLPRDYLLGVIIGNIVLEDPTLFPRIKKLYAANKDINFRPAVVTDLLPSNPDNQEVFDWTHEIMKDTADKRNAGTAATAMWKMKTDKPARCDAFMEHVEGTEEELVSHGASFITSPSLNCEAHFDKVLAVMDKHVKAKKANGTDTNVLRNICAPKSKAKPAQQATALALAKTLADDKTLDGLVRAGGIDAAFACDEKGGKAYANKFAGEKNEDIKSAVWRANRPKK